MAVPYVEIEMQEARASDEKYVIKSRRGRGKSTATATTTGTTVAAATRTARRVLRQPPSLAPPIGTRSCCRRQHRCAQSSSVE
eukprot:4948329-Pleurochrysis_carterae.AAC.1